MSITLSIGDIPICGAYGGQITIPVGDCWLAYCRYVEKHIAEGRPCAVLKEFATWKINSNQIAKPKAFFITLKDSQNG